MYKNKTVLITGGSSGLGFALTQEFLKRGARVIMLSRSTKKLNLAKDTSEKNIAGSSVSIISADVGDYESLQEALDPVLAQEKNVDIVINNAGLLREGYFEKLPVSEFKAVMDANYFGCLHIAKITLPYLKKSQGRLINIASMAGLVGSFGFSAYCSSKYALIGLTEVLRSELKPQGVNVQLVCPPEFRTPMVEELDSYRTPENRTNTNMIPRVKIGTVVNDIFTGIEQNTFRIMPGRRTKVSAFVIQHFPWLGRNFVDKQIKGIYVGP
jgi:3-dehydrosphinganine reductase